MTDFAELESALRGYLELARELLEVVQRENEAVCNDRKAEAAHFDQFRKDLLPRLEQSLARLRKGRATWQLLSPAQRHRHPQVRSLLRLNQDLIMRILLLERQNEQARLGFGLRPAAQVPAAERHRPHFVTDLYRRNSPPPAQL
jgi:hypothetical protein